VAERNFLRAFVSFALLAMLVSTGSDARGQSVAALKERMAEIQKELDATTQRIEDLRTEEDTSLQHIAQLDARIGEIEEGNAELERRVIARARTLYMGGSTAAIETLLSARDIGELAAELEYATRISDSDTSLFLRYSRIADELRVIRAEEQEEAEKLAAVRVALSDETEALQQRFRDAQDDYEALKRKLAAAAAREAAAQVASSGGSGSGTAPTTVAAPAPNLPRGSMTCPIDGPNSFIDSWGYPRSGGRTHEGTDMMAAEGTPVVAITDGTITYAGYGSSAGNWIVLSGADGNGYWYMHNRENLVTGGSVKVGQQIATVGNTGNASGGAPHVHFEYHPGGGGPVNPYSMLRSLC
jgi:murein DD-endopeptidase MepM/ murein hydrolase activator NlpD